MYNTASVQHKASPKAVRMMVRNSFSLDGSSLQIRRISFGVIPVRTKYRFQNRIATNTRNKKQIVSMFKLFIIALLFEKVFSQVPLPMNQTAQKRPKLNEFLPIIMCSKYTLFQPPPTDPRKVMQSSEKISENKRTL